MSKLREARRALGPGTYLSVGVERTRRRPGTTFAMRYYTVKSLTEAWQTLRWRMGSSRMRANEVGEVVLFSQTGERQWVLGGYMKRAGGRLEKFGDQGLCKG